MSKADPTSLAWGLGVVHLIDIHTAKLPTKDVSLDYALMRIDTNTISPWMNPIEWIRADSNYLHVIVDSLGMLVKSDEIQEIGFHKIIIYPVNLGHLQLNVIELTVSCDQRLITYVFAHLMHCTSDARYFLPTLF
jgi:hypothetical protein